jgi:hypothetical protein
MPWWIKYTRDGETRPRAMGQFDTEEEALECLEGYRKGDPDDGKHCPKDPGEVVEYDGDYPHTLPHPVGREVRGGIEYQVYSDGSADPITK